MCRPSYIVFHPHQQTNNAFVGVDNKPRLLFLYQFKYKIVIFSSRVHKIFFPQMSAVKSYIPHIPILGMC